MESLATALPWIQIALAVIISALVLLQQSEASLGSAFGGGMSDSVSHTRRGSEKIVFVSTIVVGVLFVASAILALLI